MKIFLWSPCAELLSEDRSLKFRSYIYFRFWAILGSGQGGPVCPPPPAGRGLTHHTGWGRITLHWWTLAITPKRYKMSLPNLGNLLWHPFYIFCPKINKFGQYFFVMATFVTSLPAILGQKVANVWVRSKDTVFNETAKKAQKDNMSRSTKCLSRIFDILWFWPRNYKNKTFFLMTTNPKFSEFKKRITC